MATGQTSSPSGARQSGVRPAGHRPAPDCGFECITFLVGTSSAVRIWPLAKAARPCHQWWASSAPRSKLRRGVFPSMGMMSPAVTSVAAFIHVMKQREKASGSSAAKSRPKVSYEGIPCGSLRNERNQASLDLPIRARPSYRCPAGVSQKWKSESSPARRLPGRWLTWAAEQSWG